MGIQCRVYNPEEEIWENSWEGEKTNTLPSLVEVTLYMDPIEEFGEPVKLTRVVEIPIGPAVTGVVSGAGTETTADSGDKTATESEDTDKKTDGEKSGTDGSDGKQHEAKKENE